MLANDFKVVTESGAISMVACGLFLRATASSMTDSIAASQHRG